MATTFTIPLVTLPVGSQQFGPAHPVDAETQVIMTIDRTVAGGLNSLTTASTVNVDVQQSNDGGSSWRDLGGWGTVGGPGSIKNPNSSFGGWWLLPGTSRQLRATVTVSGPSSIAVAGTITSQ